MGFDVIKKYNYVAEDAAVDCHIPICVVDIDRSPFRKGYNMSLKKAQNILYESENYKDVLLKALPEAARQE